MFLILFGWVGHDLFLWLGMHWLVTVRHLFDILFCVFFLLDDDFSVWSTLRRKNSRSETRAVQGVCWLFVLFFPLGDEFSFWTRAKQNGTRSSGETGVGKSVGVQQFLNTAGESFAAPRSQSRFGHREVGKGRSLGIPGGQKGKGRLVWLVVSQGNQGQIMGGGGEFDWIRGRLSCRPPGETSSIFRSLDSPRTEK